MSPVFTWTPLCQQRAELSGSATRKQIIACMSVSELLIDCCVVVLAGVYNVEYSLPRGGGGENKIKWFGDGEENQKLEKKKKENL